MLTPHNLLFALLGCVMGMLVGVLPGFGPAAAVSLLIPITFTLDATTALITLSAILYGAAYGGTTTAVLLNIPGEASSVATAIDGYQMAKQGRAGPALVVAALASFVGGTIAVVGFVLVAPFSRLALEFGPPELFAVALLGMTLMTSFVGSSPSESAAQCSSRSGGRDRRPGPRNRHPTFHDGPAQPLRRHQPGRRRDGRLRSRRGAVARSARPTRHTPTPRRAPATANPHRPPPIGVPDAPRLRHRVLHGAAPRFPRRGNVPRVLRGGEGRLQAPRGVREGCGRGRRRTRVGQQRASRLVPHPVVHAGYPDLGHGGDHGQRVHGQRTHSRARSCSGTTQRSPGRSSPACLSATSSC